MKLIRFLIIVLLFIPVSISFAQQPSGNLSVWISSDAEFTGVFGNDTIVYVLFCVWDGEATARLLTVTNILPSEVTFLSSDPAEDQHVGQTQTWTIDSIEGASVSEISVKGLVQPGLAVGTALVDTARISGPVNDEDSTDNIALCEVSVESTLPSLWVSAMVTLVTPEGTTLQAAEENIPISISIQYANYSAFPAPSVILCDSLPDSVGHSQLLLSSSVTPTTTTSSVITWDLGMLQPYETGEIDITLNPTASGYFQNITSIYSSSSEDRDSSDNVGYIDYEVVPILEPVLTVPSLSSMNQTDTISMGRNPTFEGIAQAGSQVLLYLIPAEGCLDSFPSCVDLDSYIASATTGPDRKWVMNTAPALGDTGLYYIYFLAKRVSDGEYSLYGRDTWLPIILYINPYIDEMGIDESTFTIQVGQQVYKPGTLSCMVGGLPGDTISISVLMDVPDSIAEDPSRWKEYAWLVYSSNASGTVVDTLVPNMHSSFEKNRVSGKPLGWYQDLKDWFGCWEGLGCDKEYEPPVCPGCVPRPRPRPRVGVDPAGYVYDPATAKGTYAWPSIPPRSSLITSATVTAYARNTDTTWILWPAGDYYQVNPQVTDATTEDKVKEEGYYAFIVPGGQYIVTSQSPGYLDYSSPILTVINSPVYHNIGMRRMPKGQTTGIFGGDGLKTLPESYTLYQNYPNPFNPSTIIGYSLPVASTVTLRVFDILGREVVMLVNHERQVAGRYAVPFMASSVSSGVYFYQLKTNTVTKIKKMLLMK